MYRKKNKIQRNRVLCSDSGTFSSRVPKGRLLSNLGVSMGRSDSVVVVLVVVVVVVGVEFSLSSSLSIIIGLAPVDPT